MRRGFGYGAKTDRTSSSSQTNAVSTLSAGRDININAGHNINLVAAQLEADRDVNLKAANDVNLLAAQDVSNYEHVHKELFAGVTEGPAIIRRAQYRQRLSSC